MAPVRGRWRFIFVFLVVTGCFANGSQPKEGPLPPDFPPTGASLYQLLVELKQEIPPSELAAKVPGLTSIEKPEEVVDACRRLGLRAIHRKADWRHLLLLREPFLVHNREGHWSLCRMQTGNLQRLDAREEHPVPVSKEEFLENWTHDLIVVSRLYSAQGDGKPRIRFAQMEHDFGDIWQEEKVEHVFAFENIGSGTLEITNVQAGCGCSEVLIGRFSPADSTEEAAIFWGKTRLGPGESGVAKFIYDPGTRRGKQTSKAIITTNDLKNVTSQLRVTANVKVPLEVSPSVVAFGRVTEKSHLFREVRVAAPEDPAFEILEATVSIPQIGVTLKELGQEEGEEKKGTYLLTISLDVNGMKVPQQIKEKVFLRTTSKRRPSVQIPVTAWLTQEVSVLPEKLEFKPLLPNRHVVRFLTVTNAGDQPVKIVGVENNIPNLSIETQALLEGKQYRIGATLETGETVQPVSGEIVIETDHPEYRAIRVPVVSSIPEPPSFPGSGSDSGS